MPVYNARTYLRQSVGSVLAQTCPSWELIIVDDGSTDDSYAICRELADGDTRIRLFQKENGGPGAARNYGLDLARGEYILFADSDDAMEPQCLEFVVSLAAQHRADMVIYNFDYLTPEGELLESGEEHPIKDGVYTADDIFWLTYEKKGYVLSILWNKLVKRSCFGELRFMKLRMCEDEVLFPWLVDRCERICITDQVLYHYYQHGGSVMRQPFGVRNVDQLFSYYDRFRFYLKTERRELSYISGRTYWENLRQHYLKYDLKDKALAKELKLAKQHFNSVMPALLKNGQLGWREKLQILLFRISPSGFKRYIQFRSK